MLALLLCFTIAEINNLITSVATNGTVYHVTAQLIARSGSTVYLSDTSGCTRVKTSTIKDFPTKRGTLLSLTVVRSPQGLPLTCTDFHVLGEGPAPQPTDITGENLSHGQHLNQYVRVKGVVLASIPDEIDSRYNWTILRTPSGNVTFATPRATYSLERLRELIDAEATVEGLSIRFSTWRNRLGGRIDPIGDEPLLITRAPPQDLDRIPPLGDQPSLHRQRTSGHVVAVSRTHFFLRTDEGTYLRIQPTEPQLPALAVGARVTVAGFYEQNSLQDLTLDEALVRVEDQPIQPLEEPKKISWSDLFKREGSVTTISHVYNRTFVEIRGRLVANPSADDARMGRLILTDGQQTITLDLSGLNPAVREGLDPDTTVSVRGFCLGEFDPPHRTARFPHFSGFTLIPRTSDDVTILAQPPWWTPGRLMAAMGVLALFLVATLVWNRALHNVAERRAKELAQEQTNHAKAELKVEERTRLAVELHDSISQTLTGVALQIETALSLKDAAFGPAERLLLTARQMLASCRQELRCCLWDLRSRTFEENDLTEAIRRTIEPHTANRKVAIRFNVARDRLSEATVHAILKIIRELVVNAIRHGQANVIQIAGDYAEKTIHFSVRDDGCGFDPEAAADARQGHFGLQGIRERARARQGSVRILSSPGQGTKVIVTLKDILT